MIKSNQKLSSKRNFFDAGYTLTELLVVMVIIALLTGIVAPRLMGRVGKAKSVTAKTQIENIISALEIYRLDVGDYPSVSQGLQALVSAPDGANNWDGPYMRQGAMPLDPWGNPYRYANENGSIVVYSYGRDNAEGGTGENGDIRSGN